MTVRAARHGACARGQERRAASRAGSTATSCSFHRPVSSSAAAPTSGCRARPTSQLERRPSRCWPPGAGGWWDSARIGIGAAAARDPRWLARRLPRRPPDGRRRAVPGRPGAARPRRPVAACCAAPRVGARPGRRLRAHRRRARRGLPLRARARRPTATSSASTTAPPTRASASRPRAARTSSTTCWPARRAEASHWKPQTRASPCTERYDRSRQRRHGPRWVRVSEEFSCTEHEEPDGSSRVRAAGKLDATEAPRLREVLRRSQEAGRDVLLDLSDLSFIDRSGLHGSRTQPTRPAGTASASRSRERCPRRCGGCSSRRAPCVTSPGARRIWRRSLPASLHG